MAIAKVKLMWRGACQFRRRFFSFSEHRAVIMGLLGANAWTVDAR